MGRLMQIRTFKKPRFYLRNDPDVGWTLALWKWRVFFYMRARLKPPNVAIKPRR